MRAIFFDEVGFTGDALLDPDQPSFVYSGVAVEPGEAERLVADVRRDSQALEVKGTTPNEAASLASTRGRAAYGAARNQSPNARWLSQSPTWYWQRSGLR